LYTITSPAPTRFAPLSLHDALPISRRDREVDSSDCRDVTAAPVEGFDKVAHLHQLPPALQSLSIGSDRFISNRPDPGLRFGECRDRKSTRLNSSHVSISYAVFCLTK